MSGDELTEERCRAIVWDPKCPARLCMATSNGGNNRGGGDGIASSGAAEAAHDSSQRPLFDYLLSQTGAHTCNKFEIAALVKIIQANEVYHDALNKQGVNPLGPSKVFSRTCREALHVSLAEWEEEMNNIAGEDVTNNEKSEYSEKLRVLNKQNLDLLKSSLATMQLSDTFLPLLPTRSMAYLQEPFNMEGAASANFVRYLRYHHLDAPESSDTEILTMLDSPQPDRYGGGTLYWRYLEALVLAGLLEQAWETLAKHSQFRAALNLLQNDTGGVDPGVLQSMEQVYNDFLKLREILLWAPLPGGRNDFNDDGLHVPSYDDMETEGLLGSLDVAPADCSFWEVDTEMEGIGDTPMVYIPEKAIQRHKHWKTYIQQKVRHKLRSIRLIPQLGNILSILCGDFSQVTFGDWSDELCATILYNKPDCRPRELSKMTDHAIGIDKESRNQLTKAVVDIMAGNAGAAISTIYHLGAGSGAALPTTLLAVIYDMFVESGIMFADDDDSVQSKCEYLTDAANAIVSSLASEDTDLGIDLATRFLVPYVVQNNKPSDEVIGCLSEILEGCCPTSDASAKNLLNRCEQLLSQYKIVRVIDSCSSIVLSRYQFHVKELRMGTGLAWLFRGIKIEAISGAGVEYGSCYKQLVDVCYSMVFKLLTSLSNDEELDGDVNLAVQEIASENNRERLKSSRDDIKVANLAPVVVFTQAHEIFTTIKNGDRALLSKCFLDCFSKEETSSGPPSVITPLPFQVILLKIACNLILKDFAVARETGGVLTTSAFNKHAIAALMESLSLVEMHSRVVIDVGKTKEILLRGLSQAIIAENTTKRIFRQARGGWKPLGSVDTASIRSASLHEYSRSVQEAVVRNMLGE